MRLPDEVEIPAQINIVPMIDVIFAILTFFIMSTLFLTKQEGLPVNLPQAQTAQRSPVDTRITVTIANDGLISINQKPTNIEALIAEIQALAGNNPEPLVIINADEGVNHGRVVVVMDKVRQIKGVRLAIATQKP